MSSISDYTRRQNRLRSKEITLDKLKVKKQIKLKGNDISKMMGSSGTQGPPGPSGTNGVAGPTGSVGPTGTQGPAGSAGPTGTQGPAGSIGPTGTQGPAGSVGPTGTQGPAGSVGPTGTQGPAGSSGAAGSPGSQGPQGPPGASGSGSGLVTYVVSPKNTDISVYRHYPDVGEITLLDTDLSTNGAIVYLPPHNNSEVIPDGSTLIVKNSKTSDGSQVTRNFTLYCLNNSVETSPGNIVNGSPSANTLGSKARHIKWIYSSSEDTWYIESYYE